MDFVTLANLVSSIGLLLLTWVMTGETQRLREAETEPEVSLYLDSNPEDNWMIDIVLKNNGRGAAEEIKFEYTDQKLPSEYGVSKKIAKLSDIAILEGLPFLAPGQEIRCFFSDTEDQSQNFAPVINMSYVSRSGKRYKMRATLATKPFCGINGRAIELRQLRWAIEEIRDKFCQKGDYKI